MNNMIVAATRVGVPHGEALNAVVAPMIDGNDLVAVKVFYLYGRGYGARDVGAFLINKSGDAQGERALNLAAFCEAALFYPELAGPVGYLYVGRLLHRWHKMKHALQRFAERFRWKSTEPAPSK